MSNTRKFEKILAPGQIGNLRIRNRIIKTCGGAEDVTGINRAFLEAIARGGAGLIIWGDVAVEYPRGVTIPITPRHLENDENIPVFGKIADAVHKHGCPIFMQLFHAGPQAMLKGGLQTVSSSSLTETETRELMASMNPRELTIPEIEDLVDKFAETAVRARKAGFDGVEVNAARMHLINSFLSRAWNKRQDQYGCASLETRARFLVEIVREMKRRLGRDFPVTTLINGIELKIDKGITVEEAQGFAGILQGAGVDAIHVRAFGYHGFDIVDASSEGVYHSEFLKPLPKELDWSNRGKGAMATLAAAVKKVVSIPVITVGRLDPVVGEKILEDGRADFIGICKGLMADPEIPNKIADDRLDEIAQCAGCGDCSRSLFLNIIRGTFVPIRCRVNPALGYDEDYEIQPAPKKKKVVVAGGGPAGMEAARVAALRGHEVILFEKEDRLGGLLPWVALVRGLDVDSDATVLANYLKNQITKLGVRVRLGEAFTPSAIQEVNPDVVILATGGVPGVPKINGLEKSNVLSMDDLYRRMKDDLQWIEPGIMRGMNSYWDCVGRNVVIVGGAIEGCGLAGFLAERGRNVTLVETGEILGGEPLMRFPSMRKVTTIPKVQYQEITDRGLRVTTAENRQQVLAADTIITAASPMPDTELLKAVEGKVSEAYLIGLDDNESNCIMNAIGNGYRIAKVI
ncbi:MAG TPA: FAD-dependent oxidoreductase [Acidobacteriota bacterium]|nr:FAD-dependent oxidoreductase [Acidobacteriota bacterium]